LHLFLDRTQVSRANTTFFEELIRVRDTGSSTDESTSLLHPTENTNLTGNHVEQSLDLALAFAEDCLLHRQGISKCTGITSDAPSNESELAILQITNISPVNTDIETIKQLFSYFYQKTYCSNDLIWNQGSLSDCVKLLVHGRLIAHMENEAGTSEIVYAGNTVGELGLLQGLPRMSSLRCHSEKAVL
jgi:hypothetical protein